MSEMTIVQLTDLHLRPTGELVHGVVDTDANLLRALTDLRASGRSVDALVLSGDLADNGSPEAYRRLRAAVEPVAAELGAEIVYVMGNHDERAAFGEQLLDSAPGSVDTEVPHDHCVEVGGLRIVALDSTTPHRHEGRLEQAQLAWLTEQLRTDAPRGTLLVLHHPPVPSPLATTDFLKLEDADRLADALTGSDVRMILCGHNHLTGAAALAGIPVWIGPALSYRIDPMAPVGRHRGFTGFGYSRIDLVASSVLATAIELTPAAPVYDRPEAEVLAQLAAIAAETR
ncbi:metallophosphoesterase family protein [Nocardia caishijiensis]|uniref:3',5'-cyclic AMP phosphodiesterase CpdA n=1 Tax=Nocardia caishijiensis TaxID=184756 RepID=A0ABQ6YHQ4_9NOCA|nr:metallophosphoesterase [Nocardia caishijiensis]KAF0845304.1 3',5'-cyclic AMP phosphodiesterase CpdA [Nocardia caishijiensis]